MLDVWLPPNTLVFELRDGWYVFPLLFPSSPQHAAELPLSTPFGEAQLQVRA